MGGSIQTVRGDSFAVVVQCLQLITGCFSGNAAVHKRLRQLRVVGNSRHIRAAGFEQLADRETHDGVSARPVHPCRDWGRRRSFAPRRCRCKAMAPGWTHWARACDFADRNSVKERRGLPSYLAKRSNTWFDVCVAQTCAATATLAFGAN